MTVSSGRKCSALCRNSGPLGSLLRMCLAWSGWSSTACLLTWKLRTTKHRRLRYRLAASEPTISGIESTLWLGTLTATAKARSARFRRRTLNPLEYARLYPTLTVHGNNNRRGCSRNSGDGLATVLRDELLPTLVATDTRCGETAESRTSRQARLGFRPRSPRLSDVLAPRGRLNPTWLEWYMGFPLGWSELSSASESPDSETP